MAQDPRPDPADRTPPAPIPTVEGVADLVKRAIEGEVREGRARAEAIVLAARGYASAVERAAVGRFMHRNGLLPAAPDDHERAALALYDLVERLPELGGAARAVAEAVGDAVGEAVAGGAEPTPAESDARETMPDPDPAAWPQVRGLVARVGPVAMVGGIPQLDRVRWGERALGAFEWVARYRDRDGGVERLWGRARRGRLAAVLICEELVLHAVSDAAMAACRAGGVPFFYVGKGGVAKIKGALDTLEQRLSAGLAAAST